MNPVTIYLARAKQGSHRALRHALRVLVTIVGRPGDDPLSIGWHELTPEQCQTIRRTLQQRYAPTTVNRILSALRGILRVAHEHGLQDSAVWASVKGVGRRPPNVRPDSAVKQVDLERMFRDCRDDPGVGGCRDAAVLALMYGAGLRRRELTELDREHYLSGTVVVPGHPEYTTVALTPSVDEAVRAWLEFRGDATGPLICPVNKSGRIRCRRLSDQALYLIVLRRSQRAGVFLSPDALRAPLARKRRERRREQPAAPEIGFEVPFQGCGPTATPDGVVTCERPER